MLCKCVIRSLGTFKKSAITWEIVKNNLDKPWNYSFLSCNKFNKNKYVYKRLLSKKYFDKWLNKTQENKEIKEF